MTSNDSAMQILKLWNIRLLESIPCNAQQLNEISNFLNTGSEEPKKKGSRRSKTYRSSESGSVQRASSFSKSQTLSTGVLAGGATLSQGSNFGPPLPALPVSRNQQARSWGGPSDHHSTAGILSQESFFSAGRLGLGSARMSTSPPPLPPRPEESSSDEEDPDYAYIDENKVKGPQMNGGSHLPPRRSVSPSLDDQLEELKKDIMREKKAKKKKAEEQKRYEYPQIHLQSKSLSIQRRTSPRSRPNFPHADPEDYLEPVPSKRIQSTSTSSNGSTSSFLGVGQHSRSVSEPDTSVFPSPTKTLSQPPIFELGGDGSLGLLPPAQQSRHDTSPLDLSPVQSGANPPVLPPRTWRNVSVTSTSSINSASSVGGSAFSFNSRTASVPQMPFREDEVVSKRTYGVNENITPPSHTGNQASPSLRTDSHKEENHSRTSLDMSTPTNPLPLPPRSPNKSRRLSSSSASSGSPANMCPRCHSLRKSKTSVSKTFSLDHKAAPPLPNEENRKSLPNLNAVCAITENDLRNRKPSQGRHHHHHHHHHICGKHSPDASNDVFPSHSNPSLRSSQNMEYLELVGDSPPSSIDTELRPEIDLLKGCLQALEYLEHKVNRGDSTTATSLSSTSSSSTQHTTRAGAQSIGQKKTIQTDLDAAIQQTQQVQAELSENLRKPTTVAPLMKRNTIATMSTTVQSPTSSSTVSRSMISATTTPSRANGALPYRSSSSMASISSPSYPPPPVPPRSLVSLGGQPEQTLPKSPKLSRRSNTFTQAPPNHHNRHTLTKTRSLSRQGTYGATIYGDAHLPAPARSSSAAGTASGLNGTSIASRYNNHHRHFNGHMDSQSQTVFVHHIKGRLAHMV